MKKNKWTVVKSSYGREYAKCGGYTFRCCSKSQYNDSLADWIWVKSIQRYVCYKAV